MNSPLVTVGGPTGSGKSALAIALASEFEGEVIGGDSLQVYRHFDIGSAKLRPEEWGGVTHHLIDVAEAAKGFTAGDFVRLGRRAAKEIAGRGRIPFVTGGTGFYIRALTEGLSPGPERDDSLRLCLSSREVKRRGALHRFLRRFDPASALRIHTNDTPKLIRALEIRLLSTRNPSDQPPRQPLEGFEVLKLGLFPPRDELYGALDRRCERMFAEGLIQEVESLLEGGVPREAKPFGALGYKEALAVVEGRTSLDEGLALMQRDTRRYAKRQVTWFRREPGIVSLAGFGSDPAVQSEAKETLRRFLIRACDGSPQLLS